MRIGILAILLLGACAEPPEHVEPIDDEGDAEDVDVEAFAALDVASVAQVNPYYGGRFSDLDRTKPQTYKTARRFAAYVRDKWPGLSVIGMQEIEDAANAQKLVLILTEITGRPWAVEYFPGPASLRSTKAAIFWRSDLWTPVEVLGTRQVEALDTAAGPSTLSVRFAGIVLRRNGTSHELAMFTGKLAWLGKKHDGVPIDNGDRAEEVDRLRTWIDFKLATRPNATRVVAMDVNAGYDTAPWRRMREQFGDGGDERATHWEFGARRIDGLFWDFDGGAKRGDGFGFVGGPYRSANFGSDHRAVAARVRLR